MPAASKTSKSKSRTTNARHGSSSRAAAPTVQASARAERVRPTPVQAAAVQSNGTRSSDSGPADGRAKRYIYVYCAVSGDVNARTLRDLPALPDADRPRSLALTADISLIVADVPANLYTADKVEAQLGDIDWVGRCGSAHHAVADALVSKHTVVPLRPFTIFSSEEKALTTFRRLLRTIEQALARVQGKAEWVVRIGKPDRSRIARAAETATGGKPTTGAAFLAQKAAAKRRATEVASQVRHRVASVYDALARIADAEDRRSEDAASGLLLDAAFLVGTRHASAFKRAIEANAGELLDAGCRVSVTGPWPPYSFVSLDPGRTGE